MLIRKHRQKLQEEVCWKSIILLKKYCKIQTIQMFCNTFLKVYCINPQAMIGELLRRHNKNVYDYYWPKSKEKSDNYNLKMIQIMEAAKASQLPTKDVYHEYYDLMKAKAEARAEAKAGQLNKEIPTKNVSESQINYDNDILLQKILQNLNDNEILFKKVLKNLNDNDIKVLQNLNDNDIVFFKVLQNLKWGGFPHDPPFIKMI